MNGGIFFMNKGLLLEIPYGTRDFLPKDAKVKREIESKLAKKILVFGVMMKLLHQQLNM